MDWKKFWNQKANDSNEYKQVARIIHGKEHSEEILDKIALRVISQLELQPEDSLLDLCCGNGLLTNLISKHCRQVDAVDISSNLIRKAQDKYNSGKIQFINSDVLTYASYKKYDKILLYFSFQYIDTFEKGKDLIKNVIRMSNPNTRILIGDIPDIQKLSVYYPSTIDRLKYHIKNQFQNSDMGKFWSPSELDSICQSLKLKGEHIAQESWQPYSNYRFDYLITLE
ncbi:MAG: methyltransferase domain-containing protein [Saprospiraceae bacterium]|nr:methyltransferase domain-containing protein [Saprospiraceae bacterium]